MWQAVMASVLSHDWALQMHGFYADTVNKTLRFDVVISFDADRKEAINVLYEEICAAYPDYKVMIIADVDTSD